MATDSVDIAPAVTLQTGGDSTRVARDSVPQADSSLQVDVAPVVTLQTSGDSTQVARDSAPQADSSLQPRANTYGISEASTQPKASVRRPVSDDVKPKITDGDRAPTVGDRATQRSELKEVRIQVASSDGRAGTLFSWVDTLPAAWSHQAIDFQGRKTGVRWSSLLRNALAICLAGLNFAFGAAWRSFTRVLVFGSISGDDEVLSAWICLAIGIAVLVPPMGLLHRLRLSYQESAQDAAVHGDVEKARMYNYRASNIAQIAGFACGSAIVYHLADAADVTLPRSHWGWRLLGVLLMQMVLWAFCLLLFWGSSRYVTTPRQRRLLNQISGAWVSYSAAATAFFLLDVMEVALMEESIEESTNLDFLGAVAATLLVASSVAFVWWHYANVRRSKAVAEMASHMGRESVPVGGLADAAPEFADWVSFWFFRKLVPRTVLYLGILTTYAYVYAHLQWWLVEKCGAENSCGTMKDTPLGLLQALIFFLLATAVAVAVGSLAYVVADKIKCRVCLVPKESLADLSMEHRHQVYRVIETSQLLAQTSLATVTEAMTLLVGAAFDTLARHVLRDLVDMLPTAHYHLHSVLFELGYCVFLSLVMLTVVFRFAPAPLQAAETEAPTTEVAPSRSAKSSK